MLEANAAVTGLDRVAAFGKSNELRVSFGADGVNLAHGSEDAGSKIVRDNENQAENKADAFAVESDGREEEAAAVADIETESESESAELEKLVGTVEESASQIDTQRVEIDLDTAQPTALAAGMKTASNAGSSEKNQTTNRIDIHLVDISETSEKVDSSAREKIAADVNAADATDEGDSEIAKDRVGSPRNDSNKPVGIRNRSAANDRAFKQIPESKQPTKGTFTSTDTVPPVQVESTTTRIEEAAAIAEEEAIVAEIAEAEEPIGFEEMAKAEEAAQAHAIAKAEAAAQLEIAEAEELIGFEEMAKAEEAAQAHAIAKAEAAAQLEIAAQAAADAEEAAAAEADLTMETLSESALIEAELIEEFANIDPTLDTEALEVIVREAELTQELSSRVEQDLVVINNDESSPDTIEDEEVLVAVHEDANAESNTDMVVQPESDNFPDTADYYDSLEVDMDETNSVGFGGLPTSVVSTRPQGYFVRLWRAARRAVRNVISAPLAWIKKRK